jgi:hypothetical protein
LPIQSAGVEQKTKQKFSRMAAKSKYIRKLITTMGNKFQELATFHDLIRSNWSIPLTRSRCVDGVSSNVRDFLVSVHLVHFRPNRVKNNFQITLASQSHARNHLAA